MGQGGSEDKGFTAAARSGATKLWGLKNSNTLVSGLQSQCETEVLPVSVVSVDSEAPET